ncbi:MAG TPA: secretin N-terminal domain-containing protein [Candidatus Paceibacterota bacterium]|nr:secretin N-terminal domain-containing protein [Verrucomicrobiota bacterium]HRZ45699.1 secretin N-terminal domain-containing protein [Candidatus Paceibacterota bacterium]
MKPVNAWLLAAAIAIVASPVTAQTADNPAPPGPQTAVTVSAAPQPETPAPSSPTPANSPPAAAPAAGPAPSAPEAPPAQPALPSAPTDAAASNAPPAQPPSVDLTAANGEKGLRFNFRGVPLDTVLDYLSKATGLIIVKETEVRGRVDAWSYQPLTQDEAINLLNTVLNKNGYAAVRNDRTLTIVSRDEAKKRDIPVRIGADPEAIPKNDEMVTHIVPIRYANALQMTKDLQPLLPTYATMTANESGNAIVLTDTQADIRRMVQIVKALDTSISSISAIRVFPLAYADAKELANIVKELFPTQNTSTRGNDPRAEFMARFGGGPGGDRGGGQANAPTGTGVSEARRAASRVAAVADERTNSLVVSAPDEYISTIEQLVREIDTNAEDITELRVFHLSFADPVETADLLTSLFPNTTSTGGRSAFMFRGPGGPGGMFGRTGSDATSDRAKKKGQVVAVPDQRTSSVVVSASSEMMPQIAAMIAQLDSSDAKRQKVFVYSLENADVASVEDILRNMFEGQNTRNTNRRTTTGTQNQNPFSNRSNFGQGTSSGNRTGSRSSGSSFGGSR